MPRSATRDRGGARASTGAEERGETPRGERRDDAPHDFWKAPAEPIGLGRDVFKVRALLGDASRPTALRAWIEDFVESVTWTEGGQVMTGELALRQPEAAIPRRGQRPPYRLEEMPFGHGDRIRLYHSLQGRASWKLLWELRIGRSSTLSARDGTLSLTLADEADRLKRSRDDWKLTKGERRHRKGWPAHKIVQHVARRYGVPLGKIVKAGEPIRKLVMRDTSPLEVITEAYARARKDTGKRYVIAFRRGKLSVTRERRPKHMLIIGQYVLDATKTYEADEAFATAITARGRVSGGKKKKGRDVEVRLESKNLKRFGLIHRVYRPMGEVGSKAELRSRARRELQRSHEGKRELSFTHPGIPHLRRGDACTVDMPELGMRRLIFVKDCVHSLSSADYTVEVTCGWTDPVTMHEIQDRRAAARKRDRREEREERKKDRREERPPREERRSDEEGGDQ